YDFFLAKIKDSVQILTHVPELTKNGNSFSLFPNPSFGRFSIESNNLNPCNLNVVITNSLGQKVYLESTHHVQGHYFKSFDFINLSKGIYFVEIKTDSERTIKKIILE
ncbi:MAG: T9SS type A sorting domain-containing protein, partial [Bacteroidia bacterium]